MRRRKLKLCIALPDHWAANFGGAEYQVKVLIDRLLSHDGFEIVYLARNVNDSFVPGGYSIKRVRTWPMLVRHADFFDAPSLYALLRSTRPDVIYQTVGCAYTGVAAYYARRTGARSVWQIASDIDVQPLERKWTRHYPFRYVEKKILEYGVLHSTKVIAQTKFQDALLRKYYGRSADAIVPNFHPVPDEEIRKSGDQRVVWVANLKPLKRPELFIRLARELRERDIRARFTMIGRGGDSEWHRRILEEISRESSVEYLGELPHEQVNRILAQAHVLVNTSEYEGFPNTFIQAWMRGVPVVSLAVNPDGLLGMGLGVVSGTYEKLREALSTLLRDEALRYEMGSRARKFALETFSEKNADRLIDILIG